MHSILVVEDDGDLRELLSEVFASTLGCKVLSCATLEQVTRLKDQLLECNVAFLDVDLGRDQPSGLDAFDWLLRNHFHGAVYFLTGHGREHPLVAKAAKMGQAEVLKKPFPIGALIARAQRSSR